MVATLVVCLFLFMGKFLFTNSEKVQIEIYTVIGQSRRPNIDDRANMQYTNAVVHEVQRMGNVVPLSVPRMTTENTLLGGYFIPKVRLHHMGSMFTTTRSYPHYSNILNLNMPNKISFCWCLSFVMLYLRVSDVNVLLCLKGTQVIPNLTSVLSDETMWKSPYLFDPQNFLSTQGSFEKPDAFIPFSAGEFLIFCKQF